MSASEFEIGYGLERPLPELPAYTESLGSGCEVAEVVLESADINSTSANIESRQPIVADTAEGEDSMPETLQPSHLSRAKEWAKRKKGTLLLGTVAASAALTFIANPADEIVHDAIETAPLVAASLIASEAMFIGGIGIMAASVGDKVGNPLKIKSRMPEIAKKANDSLLFKAGFWTNTVGAVGSAVVPSALIIAKLPPEAYGTLVLPMADLLVTVAIRKAMLTGISENAEQHELRNATDESE